MADSIPLFLDDHYVAVHKPPRLLVHRTWLAEDEDFLLQQVRDHIGQRVYPVHRLDRATSGVIVFGLSPAAARRLQAAFGAGQVSKHYRAVVRGWITEPGMIDHPLDDPETGTGRRPAATRYRPLARAELPFAVDRYPTARYSLVAAEPLTGRRHQIRRHLKHLAHPIVGDTSYGKGPHNRFFRIRFGIDRLLLVASELRFVHPYTGRPLAIRAAREPDWERLMKTLGWADVQSIGDGTTPEGPTPGNLPMPRSDDFDAWVLDQLKPLPAISARPMFGGRGLYVGDLFFGILYDGRLYFHTDERTRPGYVNAGSQVFQPNSRQRLKRYYEVPAEVLENAEQLSAWAMAAILTRKAERSA